MRHFTCILLLALAGSVRGGTDPVARFTENKGQWPAPVAFRAKVPGGALFVERDAFTFTFCDGRTNGHAERGTSTPRAHAYRVQFEGAGKAVPEGTARLPFHENFFLGNDPTAWGTGCAVYGKVRMKELYPGIDLEVDGSAGIKYSFLLQAGADPAQVRMRYTGQGALELREGKLLVTNTTGTVTEEAPVAYQGQQEIPCRFRLQGDLVTFELPNGFDPAQGLVIDPVLTFSSYSGSTADNFGFTATYDNSGHLYGGGIVFSSGSYPTTLGVLDPTFNGGTIDMGITKFTPDGSALVWSTYIGGSANESPHSLVVNDADELYVLGSSGSSNFPTTSGAYGTTFNGGTAVSPGGWQGMSGGYGYGHANGTDIVVMHLSADATTMIASTYVGGSGNDGLNNAAPLPHNFGDHFRGEIALDALGWPVVCSSTQSADIPVSANAPQTVFGGVQDAYIFRMDPLLSTLQATLFGGSGADSGYGIQFASNGQIYTTGGTTSTDLVLPGTPHQPALAGGVDGYVARWSSDLAQLQAATYVGTTQYDQSYFVQLDTDDNVYLVGQTNGVFPVSPGVYSNPGSSQFIRKYDPGLSTATWSTVIGSGMGAEDISPAAFLVSDCGQIYFSGWGGLVNHYGPATNSTTAGLPVTPDAFQATTDGNDFYLMVLDQNAAALNYATFFGGGLSSEHVDGGTARFDKHGTVYQAVCAGCPGHDDFPTTPGAWSNTNNSFNCNLGVFKFDLIKPTAHIEVDGPAYACLPGASVSFVNLSTGGTLFQWDFGDGGSSSAFEPEHTYTAPGTYTVRLVLSSQDACLPMDTAYLELKILHPSTPYIDPVQPLCPGDSVRLQAHGGHLYQWLPAAGLGALNVADPMVQPLATTVYTVIVTDSCGTDTAQIEVPVLDVSGTGAGPEVTVCAGHPVMLSATGGGQYAWQPAASLNDPASATPIATPLDTTLYMVTITTPEGCLVHDSLLVQTVPGLPIPVLADTTICKGEQVQLHASGGETYAWQPAAGLGQTNVPDPMVAPALPTTYTVEIGNACGSVTATAFVDVRSVVAAAWPDTIACPGTPVQLWASGGVHYQWWPVPGETSGLLLQPAVAGTHHVTVSDAYGCSDTASVTVQLHPPAFVNAGANSTIAWGASIPLQATGTGNFLWSPPDSLSCINCPRPVASPTTTTTYTVELTDANGCKATDQVTISLEGSLFVPNTFTPNGDGMNDGFRAWCTEMAEFRLLIFNRWGELIFSSNRTDEAWDGTYKDRESPIGTYVWRIDCREITGRAQTLYGHVTLLR